MYGTKKWLSLALAVVLLLSCLPVQTLAEETVTEETAAAVTEAPEETVVETTEATEEPAETVAEVTEAAEKTEAAETVDETTVPEEEIITEEQTIAFPAVSTITEYDEGHISFTTFEDLRELASRTYSEWTDAYYMGTDPLVFKSSLTLPKNLDIYAFDGQIKVPAGVTLIAGGLCTDELVVEGTLECETVTADNILTVTGSVICHNSIFILEETVVSGLDKITFTEEWGYIDRRLDITTDMAGLKAAIEKANAEGPRWKHSICVGNALELNESVVLSERCDLIVVHPFTIQQGCTLINNSTIIVSPDEGGKLELDGGSYMGSGTIIVWDCTNAQEIPPTALPGFDLSDFTVTEFNDDQGHYWEHYWELTKKSTSAQGDFTGDGEVGIEDVAALLWHILFDATIEGDADINGDGSADSADVVYLLWHTLFPELYPL